MLWTLSTHSCLNIPLLGRLLIAKVDVLMELLKIVSDLPHQHVVKLGLSIVLLKI